MQPLFGRNRHATLEPAYYQPTTYKNIQKSTYEELMKPLDTTTGFGREQQQSREETNNSIDLAQEDVIANYHKTMEALEE